MQKNLTFTWHLSPKQRALFESDARFRVGMGGRRFGKNEVETACEVDYAVNPDEYSFGSDNPEDVLIWHVAPTYRQAYRHGYRKAKEKIPEVLINEDNTRGSEWAPSKIELTTGVEMEFLSYGNPKGLQGEGVDLICGDEWAYSEPKIWDADLRPMLLDSGGGAILISKPLGENHFFEKYQLGATPEMPHTDGKPPDEDWFSIHATSYDNPLIPDSEIESLKSKTPEAVFRQEYLADPRAGGTLLTLDMIDYVSSEELNEQVDERWEWHIGVDIGVTMDKKKARENDTDYWAAAIVCEHFMKNQAYVLQVVRKRGQTPAQAAEWLNTIMSQVPTNRCYVESVQAQRWFQEQAKDVGLTPVPIEHDRPKEERITFLSVPFSQGLVKLVDWSDHSEQAFDWSDFRTEWAGFPNSNHDDQLDALEMALRHCNLGGEVNMMSADPYGDNNE